jgi:hypothetical protein
VVLVGRFLLRRAGIQNGSRKDYFPRDPPTGTDDHCEHPRDGNDKHRATLGCLPAELILNIANHLSAPCKAALALVSRDMLRKQGTRVLSLSGEAKYMLLELLDRDGMYPSYFLCSYCKTFHHPLLPKDIVELDDHGANVTARKSAVGPACDRRLNKTYSNISFGMVASVLRSARLGNDIYPLAALSTHRAYRLPENPWAVVTRITAARVHKGRLLVKTKIVYYSATTHEHARRTTDALERVAHEFPGLASACAHTEFSAVCGDFLHEGVWKSGKQYRCLWSHPTDCLYGGECGWPPRNRAKSRPHRGCGKCLTDLDYARIDVPVQWVEENHRVVVMASWQDLGDGRSTDGRSWASHIDEGTTDRRVYAIGKVREYYESSAACAESATLLRASRERPFKSLLRKAFLFGGIPPFWDPKILE